MTFQTADCEKATIDNGFSLLRRDSPELAPGASFRVVSIHPSTLAELAAPIRARGTFLRRSFTPLIASCIRRAAFLPCDKLCLRLPQLPKHSLCDQQTIPRLVPQSP
jgi:hypothetical protein